MAEKSRRVFISWSGERAKAIGLLLRDWAIEMFDDLDPWLSDVDIASGAQSLVELHNSLGRASMGLVVVTQDNQSSPWLNYEAGALSRAVAPGPTRVIPLLVGFRKPTEIAGPLGQFQARVLSFDGLTKVTDTLCELLDVDQEVGRIRLSRSWPTLSKAIEDEMADAPTHEFSRRSLDDMVEEALSILRRRESWTSSIPTELAERLVLAAELLETPLTDLDLRSKEARLGFVEAANAIRSLLAVVDYEPV